MTVEPTVQIPVPTGPLAWLANAEQRWKYGPELYWYVTRPFWWARWRVWSWRYWRAVRLLEISGKKLVASS